MEESPLDAEEMGYVLIREEVDWNTTGSNAVLSTEDELEDDAIKKNLERAPYNSDTMCN